MEVSMKVDDNKVLKLVYTFFLGVLLAIFIGVGIDTFYPGPQQPEYPTELYSYGEKMTAKQQEQQKEFDKAQRDFEKAVQPYNRNVSIISLVAAVVLLGVSLYLEKRKVKIVADGIMLGGLFTLIYSLIRGFAAEDSKYVFVVVTVSLAVVLYLGYHRFVEPAEKKAKKTKK